MKSTKPKAPRKPRNKVQVRAKSVMKNDQQTNIKLNASITDATEALLNADQFILPRALPTHVVPIHTNITLSITNTDAVVVAVYPDNEFPISVITTNPPEVAILSTTPEVGEIANLNDYQLAIFNLRPNLLIANTEQVLLPTTLVNTDERQSRFIFTNELNNTFEFSSDREMPKAYPGLLTDIAGAFQIIYDTAPLSPADFYAVNIQVLDGSGRQLQLSSPSTVAISDTAVTYSNFNTPIVPGSYWRILLTPGSQPKRIKSLDMSVLTFNVTQVSSNIRRYRPVNRSSDWDDLVASCTRWSFTAGSLTMTNTASALVNGGNCATALLPTGVDFPVIPTLAFDFISGLPYNKMTGPLKDGTHVSYLADDLSQYFFKPIEESRIAAPVMVAVFRANTGNVSSAVSLQVKVNLMYEWITPNVTRTHLVSPAHAAFFEALIGAITQQCAGNDGLASHNPDHMKKIRDIAKKVSNDPNVRAAATAALRAGKSMITTFGPLLLGAVM